jgi:hypothetical protein
LQLPANDPMRNFITINLRHSEHLRITTGLNTEFKISLFSENSTLSPTQFRILQKKIIGTGRALRRAAALRCAVAKLLFVDY